MWDHLPSADELLADRVARGWQPTPTATRSGAVILGHAACLVAREPEVGADPNDEPHALGSVTECLTVPASEPPMPPPGLEQ